MSETIAEMREETIADIVAEMRNRCSDDGRLERELKSYADRIELAAERVFTEVDIVAFGMPDVVDALTKTLGDYYDYE